MYSEGEDRSTTSDGGDQATIDESMTVDEQRAALFAAAVQVEDAADRFCAWWMVEYPNYNDGVLNSVRQCDHNAAFRLLTDRTVELAQRMAIEMWAPAGHYNRSDQYFIADSDKSICVLLQKATVIEREVVRFERPETRRHEQPPAGGRRQGLAEHIDRVRTRLQLVPASDPPSSLDEAITRVTEELSALRVEEHRQEVLDRLSEWDAALLLEARAVTGDEDLRRIRTDAERELAGFRNGMTPEAYERASQAAAERLVREHHRLPVIAYS